MAKEIIFLRPFDYDYRIGKHDLYDSFDLVAKKLENPSIRPVVAEQVYPLSPTQLKQSEVIYTSAANRTCETATLFTSSSIIVPELDEIDYQMSDFISKEDFFLSDGKPDVNKARRLFFQALTDNKLTEKFPSILNRVKHVLEVIKQTDAEHIAVFTHGFLLAVIEGYIQDQSIEEDPHNLLTIYDGSAIPHRFLEGFSVKIDSDGEIGTIERVERT